jgi:hypothetical protein
MTAVIPSETARIADTPESRKTAIESLRSTVLICRLYAKDLKSWWQHSPFEVTVFF